MFLHWDAVTFGAGGFKTPHLSFDPSRRSRWVSTISASCSPFFFTLFGRHMCRVAQFGRAFVAVRDSEVAAESATLSAYAGFIFGATWSPDGSTLVTPTLGVGNDASWLLNAINVADGHVRTLFKGDGRGIGRAVWMPDGNALIAAVAETTLGHGQLQSIDYPKGELHRFTNDLSDYTAALDVTRDGKTMAAIQRIRISNIWNAPAADSSQARQLTSGERTYTLIAPGPSGKVLATTTNGDIWLMNADGSQAAVLVPDAHNTNSISACGDRYVVYDVYRNGKLEIWRADADGSNGKKIIDADPQAGISLCSPDSKWIFYTTKDAIYRMPVDGGDAVELVKVPEGGNSLQSHPTAPSLPSATRKAVRFLFQKSRQFQSRAGHCTL